jgi:GNAT superfamily N-acetyltransferase
VVFRRDGSVVGYAILIFFWSNDYGSNIIEIDGLFVDEMARGTGFGKMFTFAWLKSNFATISKGWTLQIAHKNERAIKLYEKLGFVVSRNQPSRSSSY